jgi:hypothetical protein
MRLVIQRVGKTSVVINNSEKREIEKGLLVYLGVKKNEDKSKIEKAVSKLLKLRFFENEEGKLKKNIQDIDGSIMLISNFSLYATAKKGTTLSFDESANKEEAKEIYDMFLGTLKENYKKVVSGEFRTNMNITSINLGPVNVVLDF